MAAVRERTSGARVQRGRSAQAGRGQGGRMQSGGARGRRSPQNVRKAADIYRAARSENWMLQEK